MAREFVLFVSDLQAPAVHRDTMPFLRAVCRKYGRPTRVVLIGDEADQHALNEYGTDPDLPADGAEILATKRALRPFFEEWPQADILSSNHVLRAQRRAKKAGLSSQRFRPWSEVIGAPRLWRWHKSLVLRTKAGNDVFVCHGKSKNGLRLAEQLGMCVVQGHWHTKFCIEYTSNPARLNWSMQVGCSIDSAHPAFEYDAENVARPIIGHGAIVDGFPRLLPMLLDKKRRWTGRVP